MLEWAQLKVGILTGKPVKRFCMLRRLCMGHGGCAWDMDMVDCRQRQLLLEVKQVVLQKEISHGSAARG